MTGIDFSPAAIAEARRLAEATGVAADLVCTDIYDARAVVAGAGAGLFDIVYTSWGTICWLPELSVWARTIASLLMPGGVFYFADAHPNALILEERDGRLVNEWPLDSPAEHPLVFDEPVTYSGDPTPLVATRTYQWIHSVSRIITSLIDAGLTLEFMHEHAGLPWPLFPMCVQGADGLWHLPVSVPSLPLSMSLRARKSVVEDHCTP